MTELLAGLERLWQEGGFARCRAIAARALMHARHTTGERRKFWIDEAAAWKRRAME